MNGIRRRVILNGTLRHIHNSIKRSKARMSWDIKFLACWRECGASGAHEITHKTTWNEMSLIHIFYMNIYAIHFISWHNVHFFHSLSKPFFRSLLLFQSIILVYATSFCVCDMDVVRQDGGEMWIYEDDKKFHHITQ
jgi:hypothetical protein